MNKGNLCISICASGSKEQIARIAEAELLADIIELRFDCLDESEIDDVLDHLPVITKKYLITMRPIEQGGKRELSADDRKKFWSRAMSKLEKHDIMVDHEVDISVVTPGKRQTSFISHHDLNGMPQDLTDLCQKLSIACAGTDDPMIKIAVTVNSAEEAIPLWRLLEQTVRSGKRIIPVAMGEAGKWTRILGLAHGAYLTYASLDSGNETAPGQITAEDLINVYRAKELDKSTEIYGLIAGNTSYSVSPYIHNAAFRAAGMNRVFVPMQVADIDDFMRRVVRPETREINLNIHGFAVTNPHKQAVIEYLDEIDATAAAIGAVNTIKIADGRLYGYNTDAAGFIEPLKKRFPDLKGAKIALFGAGGAARACVHALKQNGADVTLFVRDTVKAAGLATEFGIDARSLPSKDAGSQFADFDIIVNATPLGTKGEDESKTVAFTEQLGGIKLVYDLIYNPAETLLIREARNAGVPVIGGLEMLIEQAEQQYRIWTGNSGANSVMKAAALKRLQQ